MTYSDQFNIRSRFVKFNDVADAIDGLITRQNAPTTSGSSTAYSIYPIPIWDSIPTGSFVVFVPHLTNGATATLTVNNIGPSPLLRGGVNIPAGTMLGGVPYLCLYNGVGWEVLSSTEVPAARFLPITLDQVNNRVGINQATPTVALHVLGSSAYSGEANVSGVFNPTSASAGVVIGSINGNAPYIAAGKLSDGTGAFTPLRLRTSNTDRLVIDTAGTITVGGQLNANAFSAPTHYSNVYFSERAAANSEAGSGFYTRVDGAIYGGMLLNDADTQLKVFSAGDLQLWAHGAKKGTFGTDGLAVNGGLYLQYNAHVLAVPVNYISLKNPNAVDDAIQSITFDNYNGVAGAIVCRQNSLSNFQTELSFATHDGSYREQFAIRVGRKEFRNGSIYIDNTAITRNVGDSILRYNTTNGLVTWEVSSQLVKTDIIDCPYGLDEVLQFQPRKYLRTDDQVYEIGFIADELTLVTPEMVPKVQKFWLTDNKDDMELVPGTVEYHRLTAILTKAIQELNQKVEELKARLDNL